MLKVIKRTGEIVDFNKKKIEDAIMKAMTKGSGFVNVRDVSIKKLGILKVVELSNVKIIKRY